MDPSGPLVCWPIAARPPASGGGILGCEAAGIRAHVLLCLLRAEAVAGAGVGCRGGLVADVLAGAEEKELSWWKRAQS